jgi:CubicO group peptidase (beta-lactamase class C family)
MMRIAELGDRKTEPLSVCGFVVDGYETVARAFAAAIAKTTRGGAALAIQVGGETVADLWGGYADHATGRAWRSDTPTVVFSCSKGLVAILAAQLVAEGRLDLDARVASYWPEFAQGGKADVPVRYLLSHRAGLPYPARDLSKQDIVGWYPVVEELAAQVPLWEPGRNWAYHALTYGWLVGEVLRRVSGKSVGALMEEKLTGPLGAAAWFGAPADRRADVANIASSAERTTDALDSAPHGREIARCLTLGRAFPLGLAAPGKGFNDPEIQAAQIPGAGAIATARGLASIWSSTVVETVSTLPLDPSVISDMTVVQSSGASYFEPDRQDTPHWATGFMVDAPARPFLSSASFGHDGAGGQLAFADSDAKVGFGFVTNDMQDPIDGRANGILEALRNITSQ